MSLQTKGFEFGEFHLDCEDQVLLSGGNPISLTPKAYLLLRTLVENHGKVIEKQQLIDAVWPDSFVEEGNLPYTANLLRKALGDSKSEPRFIETIPRRGYRFIAPVRRVDAVIEATRGAGESIVKEPDLETRPGTRRAVVIAITVTAIILLGSAVWLGTLVQKPSAAPILSRPFSVEQLSTSGSSEYAAISSDGKYAVYSDESGGKESLWLRDLENSENVQIVPPSDGEYLGLRFSNSGSSLYFVRLPYGAHNLPTLYRIEIFGGVPVKLADNVVRRVSVSPDDKQIAFVRCRFKKDDFCSLFLVDSDGANERKVMSTENGAHLWNHDFSPDGRSIAVAIGRHLNAVNDAYIFEIDLETGSRRDFFSERFAEVPSLEWMPDGSGLLFTAADFIDGKAGIYFADRRTGRLEPLSKDAASYQTLALDGSATKLIAVQQVPDYRINVVGEGTKSKLAPARDLDFKSGGGRIVYSTFDGEIWSVNRDGSEQRQLTNSRFAEDSVRFSPDQKTIYFSTHEGGGRNVWRMNADGTDRKQLTRSGGGYPVTVTADGRNVFYLGTHDSYLYRISADGGDESVVWDKRLIAPVVSPDGTRVAHFFNDGTVRKIAVVDLNTKENIKVMTPRRNTDSLVISLGRPMERPSIPTPPRTAIIRFGDIRSTKPRRKESQIWATGRCTAFLLPKTEASFI